MLVRRRAAETTYRYSVPTYNGSIVIFKMAPISTMRKKRPTPASQPRTLKRKRDDENLDSLDRRVKELNPKNAELKLFADLPLSQPTASGLEASHYKSLTDIQRRAIPLALKGSDILGAAKTGSGKTLAFLIPVLEKLYHQRWTELDGLGALILAPTRELAVQIFEVLRKIGRYHLFSAGLVIGGKSLQEERERLHRMNILICTPGRMLQHMDQTAAFGISNLQMLVLDEADRVMDMGFQDTVDAIMKHLPRQRQTLLFSATQTKKVSDLARLSLKDPEYVSVHEAASSATPITLQQNYIVTPLPEKLDTLWSFIRANSTCKILVFLSSGKQVRFVYESFRHLRPGIPLMHIHGRQKQSARLEITSRFSAAKNQCLFATDVAARGLDFPAVDWVVQLDCPEDAETYIHRVGRTARFERDGRAVLFLEPCEEEGMLRRLEQKKVPIERINVRQKKQQSIKSQLQNMCFKDPELKYLGQKAFVSYVRSIHIQKDKEIFNLGQLPLEEYSASLGLPGAPKIKSLKGDNSKQLKNASRHHTSSSDDESNDKPKTKKPAARTKYDRMFERTNQDIFADHYAKLIADEENPQNCSSADVVDDTDFLTIKSRHSNDYSTKGVSDRNLSLEASGKSTTVPNIGDGSLIIDSKRKEKLLKSKKKLLKLQKKGTKLLFDEEGNAHQIYELEDENQFKQRGTADAQKLEFLNAEQKRLQAGDLVDKQKAKEKRKNKRERNKSREALENEVNIREQAVLTPNKEGNDGEDSHKDNVTAALKVATKRPRKWFENYSGDEERGNGRKLSKFSRSEPETLEDLEAVASGLLG